MENTSYRYRSILIIINEECKGAKNVGFFLKKKVKEKSDFWQRLESNKDKSKGKGTKKS